MMVIVPWAFLALFLRLPLLVIAFVVIGLVVFVSLSDLSDLSVLSSCPLIGLVVLFCRTYRSCRFYPSCPAAAVSLFVGLVGRFVFIRRLYA